MEQPRLHTVAALNRHDEALASYAKALELRKDYADAHFNEALTLLTIGEFRRGFEKYEWRWRRSGMPSPGRGYGRPLWLGEYPLERRTILLHAEQGLGDTIQFARYVPMLARAGAKVVLEVQPQLKALLGKSRARQPWWRAASGFPPLTCMPLGNLPLAPKTEPATIPSADRYIGADEVHIAKWRPRLEALGRPRIALVGPEIPST